VIVALREGQVEPEIEVKLSESSELSRSKERTTLAD